MIAFARNPFRNVDLSHMGVVRIVIGVVAVAMVLYHMWAIVVGAPEAIIFRGTHLVFAMILTFLMFRRGGAASGGPPTMLDYVLLVLAVAPVLYLFANYDYVVNRIYYVDDLTWPDMIMGALLIVMVIEATRRHCRDRISGTPLSPQVRACPRR